MSTTLNTSSRSPYNNIAVSGFTSIHNCRSTWRVPGESQMQSANPPNAAGDVPCEHPEVTTRLVFPVLQLVGAGGGPANHARAGNLRTGGPKYFIRTPLGKIPVSSPCQVRQFRTLWRTETAPLSTSTWMPLRQPLHASTSRTPYPANLTLPAGTAKLSENGISRIKFNSSPLIRRVDNRPIKREWRDLYTSKRCVGRRSAATAFSVKQHRPHDGARVFSSVDRRSRKASTLAIGDIG